MHTCHFLFEGESRKVAAPPRAKRLSRRMTDQEESEAVQATFGRTDKQNRNRPAIVNLVWHLRGLLRLHGLHYVSIKTKKKKPVWQSPTRTNQSNERAQRDLGSAWFERRAQLYKF